MWTYVNMCTSEHLNLSETKCACEHLNLSAHLNMWTYQHNVMFVSYDLFITNTVSSELSSTCGQKFRRVSCKIYTKFCSVRRISSFTQFQTRNTVTHYLMTTVQMSNRATSPSPNTKVILQQKEKLVGPGAQFTTQLNVRLSSSNTASGRGWALSPHRFYSALGKMKQVLTSFGHRLHTRNAYLLQK